MHQGIAEQIKRGQDASRAYLHVGKTGGTSFVQKARELAASEPHRVPILFPHEWTVPAIREALPGARISLVVRDPLERIISGFMSRERAGRPTYNSPWSSDEAIAFLFFEDVRDYLRAIISRAPRDAAAADFASRAIDHIRRGYRFHIPDIGGIDEWAGTIGRLEAVDAFAADVLGGDVHVGHAHANPRSPAEVLAGFTPGEQGLLRWALRDEYRVYAALLAVAGRVG